MTYCKIGSVHYIPSIDGYKIKRGRSGQGFIYKNEENYRKHTTRPCYAPELSDDIYTRENFLAICNNQPEIADILFEMVDWQHPETLFDELCRDNEILQCSHCGKLFIGNGTDDVSPCPYC